MSNNVRASGQEAAAEVARELAQELDQPMNPELPDERKRKFVTSGASRMRLEFSPQQRVDLARMHREVQRQIMNNFRDAFDLLGELWLIVREPVMVSGEEIKDPQTGLPEWRRTATGDYIEHWDKLTASERERFLFQLTTRLTLWEQRKEEVWMESMYAKYVWEMRFAEGFMQLDTGLKDTVEGRTAQGKLSAQEDHLFALMATYYSRKADALVRSMERISQRLKDIHVA